MDELLESQTDIESGLSDPHRLQHTRVPQLAEHYLFVEIIRYLLKKNTKIKYKYLSNNIIFNSIEDFEDFSTILKIFYDLTTIFYDFSTNLRISNHFSTILRSFNDFFYDFSTIFENFLRF